jgi:hypothetical protein
VPGTSWGEVAVNLSSSFRILDDVTKLIRIS